MNNHCQNPLCKNHGKIGVSASVDQIRICCGRRWRCPDCNHVINWSYLQLVDAGSPYCPRCKNEMNLIIEAKPSANEMFLAPCQIDELIQAGQNVVGNWTTGHLAESVRELDRVLKELSNQ